MNNVIVDKLANIPALRTLAPATLEQMAKNAAFLEFNTGEVLYYQDSEPGGDFSRCTQDGLSYIGSQRRKLKF